MLGPGLRAVCGCIPRALARRAPSVYKPFRVGVGRRAGAVYGLVFFVASGVGVCPVAMGHPKTARQPLGPVTLYFTVRDSHGHMVRSIEKDQVQVLEDGVPRSVLSLSVGEPAEMTIGLVLDWSGSRANALPEAELGPASQLLGSLVDPHHIAFAVKFNQDIRPLGVFADNSAEIEKQIRSAAQDEPRGSTAFYDTVIWASRELAGEPGRRVLIMFAEGDDNASRVHPEDAIEAAERANATVYFVNPVNADNDLPKGKKKAAVRFAEAIAAATGGEAYFARTRSDVDAAFAGIGEDLRNVYALTYSPGPGEKAGSFPFTKIMLTLKTLEVCAPRRQFIEPR